jgi:hypothetical protein
MIHSILLPQRTYQAFTTGNGQALTSNDQWQALEIQGPSTFTCAAHDAYLDEIELRLLAAAKILVEDLAQAIKSKDIHQFMQASITLAAFTNLCLAITNEVTETNPDYNMKAMEALNNIPKLIKPSGILKHFHFFPIDNERNPLINETDLAWYLDLYRSMMDLQAGEIRQIKTAGDEATQHFPYGVNVFYAFSRFHIETHTNTPALKEYDKRRTKTAETEKPKVTYKNCSNFSSAAAVNCPLVAQSLVTAQHQATSPPGKRYLPEKITREVEKQFTLTYHGPKIIDPQAITIGHVAKRCRQLDDFYNDLTAYRDENVTQNQATYQEVATVETPIQSKKDFSQQLVNCADNTDPTIKVSTTLKDIKNRMQTRKTSLAQVPEAPQQQAECFSLSKLWLKLKSFYHNTASLYFDAKGDSINRDTCEEMAKQPHKSYCETKLYCRLFPPQRAEPKKTSAQTWQNTTKNIVFRHL